MMRNLKILFFFIFLKDKFIELEIEKIIEANLKSNIGFKKEYPNKETIQNFIDEKKNFIKERIYTLKTAILQSFITSFSALILSAIVSYRFFPERWPPNLSIILGILSTFLILWATYGQVGWEIQTMEGDSYIEKVNHWWFRSMFGLGMFLLFVAIFIG